jgi:hypothetical protein
MLSLRHAESKGIALIVRDHATCVQGVSDAASSFPWRVMVVSRILRLLLQPRELAITRLFSVEVVLFGKDPGIPSTAFRTKL